MDEPTRQDTIDDGAARAWMTSHQQDLEREHRIWQASEIRWSWARLITFAAAVLVLYLLGETPPAALGGAGAFVVLFWLSVRRHVQMRDRREFADRLLAMAAESLQRCGGALELIRDWQRPVDPEDAACSVPSMLKPGPVAALTEQERDDLDLYAQPVGAFGLFNRTSTALGARRLRDLIEHPCLSVERIRARQACVKWLADHPAVRVRLMASASGLRGHDDRLDAFVKVVRTAQPLASSWLAWGLQLWTVPSVLLTAVATEQAGAAGEFSWGWPLLGLLCVNGLLYMKIRRMLRDVIEPWRELPATARSLLLAARQAADDLPGDTELVVLRNRLAAVAAPDVLPTLCSRLAWVDAGGFMHVLFNLIFFYDLHVARAVLRRIVPNREALIAGAGALADLEALSSLACFAWEQPLTCTPTPTDEPGITIIDGGHPLIEPAEMVCNDVRLTAAERTWIITGSNMAGKSTFLRMVGVNVVLAQIGGTAVAREMTFRPHRLITDLRIRDDLAKHESYFLAEVRQLRRMVVPDGEATPLLGLIDEPFRGTNSLERVAADIAVVGELIESPHLFLVATHEQELAGLADQTAARNVHFHEDLTAAGPVFDYRLRPGPATIRNALRILEREGYPPAVLERARAHLNRSVETPDTDG